MVTGGQTGWAEIACQRGHATHHAIEVAMRIGGPTAYHDYCGIPSRFTRDLSLTVWDWRRYASEIGGYCPAHDAVSQTIDELKIWEPRETALALHVLSAPRSTNPGAFWDFGGQVGWFSALAASCGRDVIAWEADEENARLLSINARRNAVAPTAFARRGRLVAGAEPYAPTPIRLAKLDVEGAEDLAVASMWPSISAGLVDHMMIEVSPCFADYYPEMLWRIIREGYRAYLLPPKQVPPVELDAPDSALSEYRFDDIGEAEVLDLVASWRQEDVWLSREGASW
jgi:hypothetical protein